MHSFLYKILFSTQTRKMKNYKTVTRPVAAYGETLWTLNESTAKWLAAFEKEKLRFFLELK